MPSISYKRKGEKRKEKKGKKKVKQALCPHYDFYCLVRINSYGLEYLGVQHPVLKLETFLDLCKQSYHSNSSFFP